MSGQAGGAVVDDPFDYDDPDATLDDLFEDIDGPSYAQQQSLAGQKRKPVGRGHTPANRLKHAQAAKAEQSNTLREKFFRWAMIGTGILLGVNVVLFFLYMLSEWGHISEAVMVAWISATVVEVLGIVYIIAKYLFEDGEQN